MSVAFRRDSDEEHKEPRFELPLPPGPNFVTAAGLEQTASKVVALEAEIAAATDEIALTDKQRTLRYWRTRLATAQLAPPPPEGQVAFGTRVIFHLNGKTRTLAIVGDDEADPVAGKIAFSAPLARALIGTEPGDLADFGGKTGAIEIVSVAAIDD